MSLAGSFDTMQLSDLLQWIDSTSKSGTLTISVDTEETYLVFKDGGLVALGSDDPLRVDIVQILLARGVLSEAQLEQALRRARGGSSVIEILLEDGALDPARVAEVQADHVFQTVLELFYQEEGSFQFSTGDSPQTLAALPDIPPVNYLRQPLSTRVVIFEGARRLDEWRRMQTVFPNSYTVVQAMPGESDNPAWQELRVLGRPISIGELCLRMGGNRFAVYQHLYQAYQLGLIGLDLMPAGQPGQAPLETVDLLLQNARVFITERQFDEARAVLQTAANLDPDDPEPRTLLRQAREFQLEHLYQIIPPHRVAVLAKPREELSSLGLSPREQYLASRLNGRWDVATLVVATPLGELETLRVLQKFLHAGIIRFSE